MDREQYKKLSEHLAILDPAISEFCKKFGYVTEFNSLGKYPRRRIRQSGDVNRFFDLQMDLDPNGDRYQSFFKEVPYSMGAGVGFDEGAIRYSKRFLVMERMPFFQVVGSISQILEESHNMLIEWDRALLRSDGRKIILGHKK